MPPKLENMNNLDILGVGNALVDETFYIEEDLVRKTNLNFNIFEKLYFSLLGYYFRSFWYYAFTSISKFY